MRRRLGLDHRLPRRPAAGDRRADRRFSGTGLHLALGIVSALYQRNRTGRGQRVLCAMQDGVLNLCRVKLRDQQRLAHGPLKEYTQFGEGIPFGEAVPRAGNDSGGGQPGVILKCKGWETDPNAYIYFITQAPVWEKICDLIGEPGWKTHPDYAKPPARLPRLNEIFGRIEQWTMTKTKFEVMNECNALDIPVGPILSMKEIAEDPSLRATGTVVEVDHPTRGKYLSVGNPIKLSDSITEVKRSPLLGEHTDEILTKVLKFTPREIAEIKASGATRPGPAKPRRRSRHMRIVVHGQQAFGKAVLEALLKRGDDVVAVYVAPEKPGQKADPLKEAALAAKLPVFQPASYRKPEVLEEFKALKPDLQVMAFVTLFVPEEFLNIPTHGSIQYHPSLLPAYRGASRPSTGRSSSARRKPACRSSGPTTASIPATCCCRRRRRSAPTDTLGTLYFDRLFPMGVEAMLESVDLVKAGKAPRIKQDERSSPPTKAAPPPTSPASTGASRGARSIRWCAAAIPAPGAWTTLDGKTLQIFEVTAAAGARTPRASAANTARSSRSKPTASPSSAPTAASRCCA